MSSLCCHAIVLCVCFRIALDAIVTLWCLVICWIWRVTLPRCRWGADGNNSRCWVFIDIKALGYLPYVLLAAVVVTQSVAAAVLVVWQVPFSPSSKPKYPRRPSPTSSVVPPNVDPPHRSMADGVFLPPSREGNVCSWLAYKRRTRSDPFAFCPVCWFDMGARKNAKVSDCVAW